MTATRLARTATIGVATVIAIVMLGLVPATPASADLTVSLTQVLSGLDRPIFLTHDGSDNNRVFILEQRGKIRVAKRSGGVFSLEATPFLDLSSIVENNCLGNNDPGEQGLLGLAFHPNFSSNGKFYVDYVADATPSCVQGTNTGKNSVAAYQTTNPSADTCQGPCTGTVLLAIDDRFTNHNGGMLAFRSDGFLYISTGDGGSGGDPDQNGQNLNSFLGKILRIDVDTGSPYGIPPSNPFVGQMGKKSEIWSYGWRNPYRFSFDRLNGDMWVGDVGQNLFEEVDFEPAGTPGGRNYGWRITEGFHCFNTGGFLRSLITCDRSGQTAPLVEYPHLNGDCSVTGGYVYRGTASPDLVGKYIFGDFCTGRFWTPIGGGQKSLLLDSTLLISGFGEDQAGELYVTSLSGTINRIAGTGIPPTPGAPAPPPPSRGGPGGGTPKAPPPPHR
ncbi:MAG: PQQ-dependent sugar dehydrogenase [Chloroflexota bacterium]